MRSRCVKHRSAGVILGLIAINTIGCVSNGAPRLRYEGRSEITGTDPVRIDAVVTVRNEGRKTAKLGHPICLRLLGFDEPERQNEVWASAPARCVVFPMITPRILVGPGDFYDFRMQAFIPRSQLQHTSPLYLSMTTPSFDNKPVPVGQLRRWIAPPNTR